MNQPVKRSLIEIIAAKKEAALLDLKADREEKEYLQERKAQETEEEEVFAAPSEPENPTTPRNKTLKEILEAKKQTKGISETGFKGHSSPSISPDALIQGNKGKINADTLLVGYRGILPEKNAFRGSETPKIPQSNQSQENGEAVGLETSFQKETSPSIQSIEGEIESPSETFSLSIELNREQLLAKEMAFAGKSFCLIGAAGTGKTTAQREIAKSLLESGSLSTHDFRIQGSGERVTAPSIAFVAFTRVASGNLRRAIHKDPSLESVLIHNVTTIHNLLEYQPETYWNYEENREAFRFVPKRTASNPLDITHLVIEESSMVGLDLWENLYAALRPGVQIIFIGDINQLPPVFGDSILNYALVQLPVVELTQVYRQAGDSSILKNAHEILKGGTISSAPDFKLVPCGTTNYTQEKLSVALGQMFPKWAEAGEYNPLTDIILCPWNKRALGTDNMNKWIAQNEGQKRGAVVYEIIAGISKLYLAVGDKIMYNKQVGVVTRISKNGRYMGRSPMPESVNLTRFGSYTGASAEQMLDEDSIDYSNLDLDKMLEDSEGDRTKECSHIVDILLDDGQTATLSAIGDFAPSVFTLAYCLTVHKAQGCEWRKVYLILHRDHKVSLCREMLYTAVTRAREQMTVIAKPDVVESAIKTQKIKGNTVKEKIEYFNSGISLNNAVYCTK